MLQTIFLKAGELNLLPKEPLNCSKPQMVTTQRGLEFPCSVGLAKGVSIEGRGIDGLLDSFGVSSDGLSGSVLVGPCCPER